MRLTDPARRAKDDRELADETRRKSLRGVELRMEGSTSRTSRAVVTP